MDNIWGMPLDYTPQYWPYWIMLAGMMVIAILAALAIHGSLRAMLRPKITLGKEHKTYLYSKSVRLWHWMNAALFILLLFSGILNHFTIGPVEQMIGLHKICGFLFSASWIVFLIITFLSGNGVHYRLRLQNWFQRCFKQVRFYLYGIMKGESHPFPATEQCKFNPIQQLAYIGVMFALVPALIVTGFVCLYANTTGVQHMMFIAHQLLAIVGMLFLPIHIYLCTTGDTPMQTFKCMFDGYHRHCDH